MKTDTPARKQLVRDAKRAALTRMEDAARTERDFRKVIEQWDHLDSNRERRVRSYEIRRESPEMLHWDKVGSDDRKGRLKGWLNTVIPPPLNHEW